MTKNIKEVIEKYLFGIQSDKFHRYKSWDHCFMAFGESAKDDRLALELGFYLASWGMYRGSGGLLQKNHLIHKGAVDVILSAPYLKLRCNEFNEIKVNDVDTILTLRDELARYYRSKNFYKGNGKSKPISATDTLVSKIILGTLGCVPAYDRYFVNGLKVMGMKCKSFNKASLTELFQFIGSNKQDIDEAQQSIKKKFQCYYPVMKIVDMYFWQIGYQKALESNNNRRLTDNFANID